MKEQMTKKDLVVKVLLLFVLLYFFLVSIKIMGASFKHYKDISESLIKTASNPFVGLLIGILATSIIQSSSTTTSMVVGMVGGGLVTFEVAIPMIMGANIGTSVTNTIVSLGNISREDEFKRAFSASTVHDFFNILAVCIFFPLQLATNFLGDAALYCADIFQNMGGGKSADYLKTITKPTINLVKELTGGQPLTMLLVSLGGLFVTLKYLSSNLKSVFVGKFQNLFDRVVFRNAATSFVLGIVLTVLVQSSSITTSLVVPLAGAGLLSLQQIVPYTLGANIGTTVTAMLASLALNNPMAVAIAFVHLLFNLFGSTLIYPFRRFPMFLSTKLSDLAIKNKFIPIGYILVMFFIIPLSLIWITK